MYLINFYYFCYYYSNANSSFESNRAVFLNIHNLLDIFMNSRQCSIMEHNFPETSSNILIEG